MMKSSKRMLALLLAFLLAFGSLSTVAVAAEGEQVDEEQAAPLEEQAPVEEPAALEMDNILDGFSSADTGREQPADADEAGDAVFAANAGEEGPDYTLSEEIVITEDDAPLASAPTATEQDCCILHLLLMLCALGVTLYYTHDRKKRQAREFELRSEL